MSQGRKKRGRNERKVEMTERSGVIRRWRKEKRSRMWKEASKQE